MKRHLRFVNVLVLSFLSASAILGTASSVQAKNKSPSRAHAKPKTAPIKNEAASEPALSIKKIEVKGNRKIETDAIMARLKSKVGDLYSPEQIREDVISLFKAGYFYDIQVDREVHGGEVQLTYVVVEKPSVTEIIFEGNAELKTDELLESSGLKVFEILNMSKIRESVEKIQKLYEDKGFFLAKVEPQIEDVKKDETVKLTFHIQENEKVKVKKITFLGNTKLKDGLLKNRLLTTEGGFFSFMSGSGSYKQDTFEADTQRLRYIYFNEGYVQVKIDRPQVYVSPDKKNIYITIRIDEGEQYDVGEIDFAGDLLYSRQELTDSIEINKRKVFSYEILQKDLSDLQAKYGDLGYAFANVIPRTRINETDRKVDITFEFDKGHKVYFGQINVVGNAKTRDKVVRRELRVREGELYNETRKRKSLENIQRLGFFEEVTFKTSTPPEHPETLNIDITVKERNTGSIQVGAGYGSVTGMTFQGQVNQANFLGKGQKLGAGMSLSRDVSVYNFNFTEPYFYDTEWSMGFDAYQSLSNRFDYSENKKGGALRLGHPIGENLSATVRYKYDKTILDPIYGTALDGTRYMVTDLTIYPLDSASGDTSSVTGIIEYDDRNDRFSPSKGVYTSLSMEYAGVGGNLRYTKGATSLRYFKKLFWEVVWRNNMSYSFITSHDANITPPFNELFLLGGPYSLRGYRFLRVGKSVVSDYAKSLLQNPNITSPPVTDPTDLQLRATKPYGGSQQVLYQMEFEFPLIAEAQIKGVTFMDVGQADDALTTNNFYSDIGFGFRWISPIGPLRFEWGFPMRPTETSPDPVVFEFSIGSPF